VERHDVRDAPFTRDGDSRDPAHPVVGVDEVVVGEGFEARAELVDVLVDLEARRADFAPNRIRPAQGVFAKYRAAVASASQGAVTIPNPPPAQIPADLAARSTETAAS